MKKWVVLLAALLLLAACGQAGSGQGEENNPLDDEQENIDDGNDLQDDIDENDEPETDELNDSEKDDNGTSSKDENDDSNETDDSSEGDKEEKTTEEILVDLTYDVFTAQREKDYAFLESIISKRTSLDKDKDIFSFENVTYPHKQELLTIPEDDLEYRYPHEVDAETMIIGFAAIDYENESSFTIDFEYIKENGEWKMNDMDINK